jgi:hypothetical protein
MKRERECLAGYTRKGQIRNSKIGEELKILNLNAKIVKSKTAVEISRVANGKQTPKKILTTRKENETYKGQSFLFGN